MEPAGLTPPPVVPTMVLSSTVPPPPLPPFNNPSSSTSSSTSSSAAAAAAAAAAGENTGRWTAEEHRLFLRGLELHGKGWKKIATLIQSRTVVQIRTHAQKYFQKLAKAHQLPSNSVVTGVDGQMVMMVNVNNNISGGCTNGSATGEGGLTIYTSGGVNGIIAPLGPDGLPVVTMRTVANGSNGAGGDATTLGMKRRHPAELINTTKRRVIGNVVRSAVREGRNIKRQQIAENKRNKNNSTSTGDNSSDSQEVVSDSPTTDEDEHSSSSSPSTTLPSVSQLLHPFVISDPAPGGSNTALGKGRKQLVNTATHGILSMAALEDAVFRLLTPAGIPSPTTSTSFTKPSPRGAKPGPDPSPTGVADYTILPSWVDAKNPPTWYNDGADLDALLDDADGLNWLSDTGDINETYPPAVSEPAAFSVLSRSTTPTAATTAKYHILPTTTVTGQDPTGGVFHPSTDSLSFLVDPPDNTVEVSSSSSPLKTVHSSISLSYSAFATKAVGNATPATAAINDATAAHYGKLAGGSSSGVNSSHESDANLLLFPDLEMGDEQAFVSALLDEPSGYDGTMSFPKLNSEMQFNGEK